jgi:hypothetical protein
MDSVTPINGLRELRKRADGIPRQEYLFAEELRLRGGGWAWIVQVRIPLSFDDNLMTIEWGEWVVDWLRPNHFKSKGGAEAQLFHRKEKEKRKVNLGLVEFRIAPKFLGPVIETKDEEWLGD